MGVPVTVGGRHGQRVPNTSGASCGPLRGVYGRFCGLAVICCRIDQAGLFRGRGGAVGVLCGLRTVCASGTVCGAAWGVLGRACASVGHECRRRSAGPLRGGSSSVIGCGGAAFESCGSRGHIGGGRDRADGLPWAVIIGTRSAVSSAARLRGGSRGPWRDRGRGPCVGAELRLDLRAGRQAAGGSRGGGNPWGNQGPGTPAEGPLSILAKNKKPFLHKPLDLHTNCCYYMCKECEQDA